MPPSVRHAGVLSAFGMGLADVRTFEEAVMEQALEAAAPTLCTDEGIPGAAATTGEPPVAAPGANGPNVLGAGVEEAFARGFGALAAKAVSGVLAQQPKGFPSAKVSVSCRVQVRYEGTDATLLCDWPAEPAEPADAEAGAPAYVAMAAGLAARLVRLDFEDRHRRQFGFVMAGKRLIAESVSVEAAASARGDSLAEDEPELPPPPSGHAGAKRVDTVCTYMDGRHQPDTGVYRREQLLPGDTLDGPALVLEATGTNVVEPGWRCAMNSRGGLVLTRVVPKVRAVAMGTAGSGADAAGADPIKLEIFNNLFMAIAEQMGVTLQNVSYSVNIKERLDFSCALFDPSGSLIANAPHVPVHLGSMSESVKAVIASRGLANMRPGDVYMLNAPYSGGTHIPDVTVITPVFAQEHHDASDARAAADVSDAARAAALAVSRGEESPAPLFFVASRGHHSEIGGITPGSMPPFSCSIEEEGILFSDFLLLDRGTLREQETRHLFSDHKYPSRNVDQNLSDLRAQVAANAAGVKELHKMVREFGLPTVLAYMGFVQANAEEAVRRVIDRLPDAAATAEGLSFTCPMDPDDRGRPSITVTVRVDRPSRSAVIDFTGTAEQQATNFNAPTAIAYAAVLYVFRTLVDDPIPLNAGCMVPLSVVLPEGSMVNPRFPAAVVAGNVEVSQAICDALYGALGVLAGSQGTMNNFTFGNEAGLNYYETICGGTGAGPGHPGCDAVHSHMTNTRLTDPEVLEFRFPLRVESFSIRQDSGGVGKHRGGNGIERRIRFLSPMVVSMLANRRANKPHGLACGGDGATGKNWVEHAPIAGAAAGKVTALGHRGSVELESGDVFVIQTPGGGAYGAAE